MTNVVTYEIFVADPQWIRDRNLIDWHCYGTKWITKRVLQKRVLQMNDGLFTNDIDEQIIKET